MWRSFADTTPTGRIIIFTLCSVSEKKKSCEFLREKHGRINLFNMKKSRWLLLGARIGVTGAGDNCGVRRFNLMPFASSRMLLWAQ